MNHDSYAELAAKWETERGLIQSLPWVWKPRDSEADKNDTRQPGRMTCEIADMPKGHNVQSLAALIKSHDGVSFDPVAVTTPSGASVIKLDLKRLGDFENCYGLCYNRRTEEEAPLRYGGSKTQLSDFRFSLSRGGNDIYAFCPDMRETDFLRRLLNSRTIKVKGVTVVDGQYRVNIPVSETPALEARCAQIHPYSAKEDRDRKAAVAAAR